MSSDADRLLNHAESLRAIAAQLEHVADRSTDATLHYIIDPEEHTVIEYDAEDEDDALTFMKDATPGTIAPGGPPHLEGWTQPPVPGWLR